jgi:hypothetical protein
MDFFPVVFVKVRYMRIDISQVVPDTPDEFRPDLKPGQGIHTPIEQTAAFLLDQQKPAENER